MTEAIVVHVPFVGGIDEKSAKEWDDPSKEQNTILNGDFAKTGSISKRLGIQHVSNALIPGGSLAALSSGVQCVGWSRSSLSVMSTNGLYQYSTTKSGLVGVSNLPSAACIRRPLVTSPTRTRSDLLDVPYNGGLLRIAVYWDVYFNLVATVYDPNTGDIIREPTKIYTNTGVLASGTIPVIASLVYLKGASGTNGARIFVYDVNTLGVSVIAYDTSTNAFSAPALLFSIFNSGTTFGVLDVVAFDGDTSGSYVACYSTSTTNLRVQRFSATNSLLVTADMAVPAGRSLLQPAFAVCTWGEVCWFGYSTSAPSGAGGSTQYETFLQATTASGAFTAINTPTSSITGLSATRKYLSGMVRLGPSDLLVASRLQGVNTDPSYGPQTTNGTWYRANINGANLTAPASGPTPLGFYPATRPFIADGEVYQLFYFNLYLQTGTNASEPQSQQITAYLCKYIGVNASTVSTASNVVYPVCTIAPRQVNANYQLLIALLSGFRLPFMSSNDPTSTRFAAGIKTNGAETAANGGALGQGWACDFFVDSTSRRQLYQASELGTELSMSGGVPFVADGQSAFEDNFFHYPEFSYAKLGGTGVTLSGVYTYAIVYEYIDAAGLSHRSAPSFTNAVTVPGGGGVGAIVHITPLSVTYRDFANPGAVFATIYRTLSNGSTFYYLDRVPVSGDPSAVHVVYPTNGSADNYSDSNLQGGTTLLYTTGGVLDDVNPPASAIQVTHRGRKAVVDETLRSVWFTTQFSANEAPGFNEALIVPFPEGGDITAIRSLDDKFVVFKASSIWIMTGDGPADTGQGSDWSVPQALSTDVGAVNWRSVVATPVGLMFKAANGIYLLGRDLQVSFIGKSVIDTMTAYPVVTSATLVPSRTQVRFTCSTSNGAASTVVVYDYLLNEWTRHSYDQLSAPIASACLTFASPQRYALVTTDGNIWQEHLPTDAGWAFDEDSSGTPHFVTLSVSVPFQKTQIQGYMRTRRLQLFASQEDDCGVKIDLSFDYQEPVRQTASWTSAQLARLPIPGQVEVHVAAKYNSSQSVRITVSDVAGTAMTSGAGMRLVAVAYELQPKGQRYRGIPVLGRH